jgi:hypothetical protein
VDPKFECNALNINEFLKGIETIRYCKTDEQETNRISISAMLPNPN